MLIGPGTSAIRERRLARIERAVERFAKRAGGLDLMVANAGRPAEAGIPPERVAEAILDAVEADRREVHVPAAVRALGLNGLAPRLTDRLVARARGPSAAPRRD